LYIAIRSVGGQGPLDNPINFENQPMLTGAQQVAQQVAQQIAQEEIALN